MWTRWHHEWADQAFRKCCCGRAHRILQQMLRQSHPQNLENSAIFALPSPKKDHSKLENCRPISLLCHLFKLYERLLVNKLTPRVDGALPEQQAGFREKRSCLDQVANLVEHIEGGFHHKEISGFAYVDLTAAYDPVFHSALLYKLIYLT